MTMSYQFKRPPQTRTRKRNHSYKPLEPREGGPRQPDKACIRDYLGLLGLIRGRLGSPSLDFNGFHELKAQNAAYTAQYLYIYIYAYVYMYVPIYTYVCMPHMVLYPLNRIPSSPDGLYESPTVRSA